LFIGNGGSFNTDSTRADYGKVTLPLSTDPTAVGFFAHHGSLDLGIFTDRRTPPTAAGTYTALPVARKYTGLEASLGGAGLQGVSAVQLIATNLVFKQNSTSG